MVRERISYHDLGSKHFLTSCSPNGEVFHVSLHGEKIMKLNKKIAEMQSAGKAKQCQKHD